MDFYQLYRGRKVYVELNHSEDSLEGTIEMANAEGITLQVVDSDMQFILLIPMTSIKMIELAEDVR